MNPALPFMPILNKIISLSFWSSKQQMLKCHFWSGLSLVTRQAQPGTRADVHAAYLSL